MTALHGVEATVAPLIRDYKRFVLATFSTATSQLADFGLKAPKAPKPLDSEKRAVATAKIKATRLARGTTSKKQKLVLRYSRGAVRFLTSSHNVAASPGR